MLIVAHDIPRSTHDKCLDNWQRRQTPPSGVAAWIIAELADHWRSLTVTSLQRQYACFGKFGFYVGEHLLQGRIMTGIVVSIVGAMVGIGVVPRDGLRHSRLDQAGILVMQPPGRKMMRCILDGAFSPYRDPDLDMADVRGQVGMRTEPAGTFGQFVCGTLDLD